tara:strand:- start:100 stop:483 length:384 start_codon:yes stop_codon:yes gene_type:complete
MVDTPGLLDRPMAERNQIEMQAIVALENTGDIVLFLIDRSEESTTPINEQESLLSEVRGLIPGGEVFVVGSKSDILDGILEPDEFQISSVTGYGLEELRSKLIEIIAADEISDPLTLPDHWPREDSG